MNHNIIWYRNDLRTLDHSGIYHAQKNGQPTFAVFYLCLAQWKSHHLSQRKIDYMIARLQGLQQELALLNITLFVFEVDTYLDSVLHLSKLIKKTEANHLYLNNDYELDEIKRDKALIKIAPSTCQLHQFDDNVFTHPENIKTGQDTAFKVFSAFKNKITPHIRELPGCLAKPKAFKSNAALTFKGAIDLSKKYHTPIFEKDAINQLRKFCKDQAQNYLAQRDLPSVKGTSSL